MLTIFLLSALTFSPLSAYNIPAHCILYHYTVLTTSLLSAYYIPAQCKHFSISMHQSYIGGLVYILNTNFLLCAETNKRLYYYYYYYIPAQCLHYFPAQCLQYLCSVLIKTLLSAYYIPGQCTNLTSAPVYIQMYYIYTTIYRVRRQINDFVIIIITISVFTLLYIPAQCLHYITAQCLQYPWSVLTTVCISMLSAYYISFFIIFYWQP